jgi:hypothetical protein
VCEQHETVVRIHSPAANSNPPDAYWRIMHHVLDIDLIFPIKDETSAWLMCLKAERLHESGIIDTECKSVVFARAAAFRPSSETRCLAYG